MMQAEEQISFGQGGGLYGMVHRPAGEPRGAIVVCNPLFEERKSAHRVLVEAARRFCREGYAVLRFDYRGCGDSAGEFSEFSIGEWEEDIRAAIKRIRTEYAGGPLGLLGVRLGGTLAFRAGRENAGFVILWEPVIDGEAYMEELLRKKLVNEMVTEGSQKSTRAGLMEDVGRGKAVDLDGYEAKPRLVGDLRNLRLSTDGAGSLKRVLAVQVGPHARASDALTGMVEGIRKRGPEVTLEALRLPPFWGLVGHADCSELIELTAAWLQAG